MTQKQNGFLGVVQFMHPGNEHRHGKDGWCAWNLKLHRRKFMRANGVSLDADFQEKSGPVTFWGEWEAPSRVISQWNPEEELPTYLVEPLFPGSARAVPNLQNTDPYVFGNQFRYTLCKQVNKNGHSSFLASLLPGTLVLFGSRIGQRFVLDTAFVVDEEIIRHSAATWQSQLAHLGDTYRHTTLEPMYWDKNTKPESTYSLYLGARRTPSNSRPFSYFPCQVLDHPNSRFPRPTLEIPEVVSHKMTMGMKKVQMGHDEIASIWQLVTTQVIDQGLRLGIRVDEPQISSVPDHLWPH